MSGKKTLILCACVLLLLLTACGAGEDRTESEPETVFFFPMEEDQRSVSVICEIGERELFEGSANLQIDRISEMQSTHFYEIKLTSLEGTCSDHGTPYGDCAYAEDYSIGYFYVDSDVIYMINCDEASIEGLREAETFSGVEEGIERWNEALKAAGEHYGYMSYRIVCMDEGMEDTLGKAPEDDAMAEGKIYSEFYHNFISVVGDERRYNLYPIDLNTREYMYIRWQKDSGIVDWASWVGGFQYYVAFHVPDYEDYFSIHNMN